MRQICVLVLSGLVIVFASGCPEDEPPSGTDDTGVKGIDTSHMQDSGHLADTGGGDADDGGADTGGDTQTDAGDDTGADAGDAEDADAGADAETDGGDTGGDTGADPMPVCGNGIIEDGEACDDKNTDDMDGCSSSCQIEQGFTCANAINLNTGSDGRGGQLASGSDDTIWSWSEGTLNNDGSTPATLPGGLTWQPAVAIEKCSSAWHDATAPAQWINSTGWDANSSACAPHPMPGPQTLRYYRATFNIPSQEAAAATELSGKMWADNLVPRIFINGTEVTEYETPADSKNFATSDATDFGTWGSSYYQAGDNEIVIAVKNVSSGGGGNPEGLLVRVPDAFSTGSTCTRVSTCGDGAIEGSEQCDDNNTDDSDGCSSACKIEAGWGCANAINLNTGSDGQGGQLQSGAADPIWSWAEGTLNMDGSTPMTLPTGLTWSPAAVIGACVGAWHGATAPAQWINSTGWDGAQNTCSPHPMPNAATLRYYRATFDISTASAAAATTLRGDLWADNQVTRIFINGSEVTEYTPPTGRASSFQTGDAVTFGSWSSSYYQVGRNEMVVAVKNLSATTPDNPEGLLVRVPDAFKVGSICTMMP